MKNLLKGITLLIILSIGLFSCKTASVMKRHYNKGYYISKKHDRPEIKTSEQTTRKESTVSLNSTSNDKLVKITAPETKKDVVTKDGLPAENASSEPVAVKEKQKPAIANTFNAKNAFEGITGLPRSLKSSLLTKDDVARDALSLLWILIVALLIIYIVGLILDLFGIGPVFHILGAIVLVLLILWLLRVI